MFVKTSGLQEVERRQENVKKVKIIGETFNLRVCSFLLISFFRQSSMGFPFLTVFSKQLFDSLKDQL